MLDDNMKPFEVFCDFDLNSSMAWTLIQSYQLRNKATFLKPFFKNDPVNEEIPAWDSYRLSKSRMTSIEEDSSKWRMTCQYDNDGVVYTDYVRGNNDKLNILTFSSHRCSEVEHINIRGYSCSYCTSWVAQFSNTVFHIDSYYSYKNCDFKPAESLPCDGSGEDNFGTYDCQNTAHRCSATATSTTQTWFGGY